MLNTGAMLTELDLCDMIENMRIAALKGPESDIPEVLMSESASNSTLETLECSRSRCGSGEIYGCAYLQVVRMQLDSFGTTNGEYLEAIFTHRGIVSARPSVHHQCARGFSDIAYMLEQRAWRADRDADTEAVAAFRHEAWSIAASLPCQS